MCVRERKRKRKREEPPSKHNSSSSGELRVQEAPEAGSWKPAP
jgi:hypothetical protein